MLRTRNVRCGRRSFRVLASQIWITLPPHLKLINIGRERFKSGRCVSLLVVEMYAIWDI